MTKGYNANEVNGNADNGIPVVAGDNGAGAISYTGSRLFGTGDAFNYPEYQNAGPGNKYLAGTLPFKVAVSGSTPRLAYKAATKI